MTQQTQQTQHDEGREQRIALAERIYKLDADVYTSLGSSLGRVFTGKKQATIDELASIMGNTSKSHYLRSELALISNMARTIPDKAARARLMREYDSILQAVEQLPTSFASVDILDEEMASLNATRLSDRFGQGDHLIICIGRTYGSAGTDIGFALADALHINYYDTEIFTEVLERLEAEQDNVSDYVSYLQNRNPNQTGDIHYRKMTIKQRIREFSRYHGLSKRDAVFFNESDLLCEKAKTEDYIIMGRCGDRILSRNGIPHVSVFITAPFEKRVRRVMSTDNLTEKQARKLLKTLDRRHSRYYNFYTGRQWGNPNSYDLVINSASYGIDGSVELIKRMVSGKSPKSKNT